MGYNQGMIKHKRNGHVAVILLAVIAVVVILGLIAYALQKPSSGDVASSQKPATSSTAAPLEPQLELQNIGLDTLDNVLVTSNALREYSTKGLKGFYAFGDKLGGKEDPRINPNFEFSSLKAGTKVISAIDGVVTFIKEQPETNDFEVFVQPKANSAWTIGYDHISNVAVKKDAKIKAGDLIGNPSVQNNGALRFEIQINKDEKNVTTHYCPSSLLSESVKPSILTGLAKMEEQWNQIAGQKLYDISAQSPAGCFKPTITAAEAEGK